MSILAYEREGSWLIEHGHVGEAGNPNFVCPVSVHCSADLSAHGLTSASRPTLQFPQCDAHNGSGCRGSILSYGWHQPLSPHVETIAED